MDQIVYNFQTFFPTIYDDARRFVDVGYEQLVVETRDGGILIYDDFDRRTRKLDRRVGEAVDDDMYRKEFGLRLRTIMSRMGETQSTLSQATGISQGIISRYINGFSSPTYINAIKLAKALRCPVTDFTYEV